MMSFSNGSNGQPSGGGTGGGGSGNNFHIPSSRESCNSPVLLQGIATSQTQKSMARVQGSGFYLPLNVRSASKTCFHPICNAKADILFVGTVDRSYSVAQRAAALHE